MEFVIAPEFKKAVCDGIKNFTYGAVDVVEEGVESIGEGFYQGLETVKSVGKKRMFLIPSMLV